MRWACIVSGLLALAALAARAQDPPAASGNMLTTNVGFASQYIFRGLTQTSVRVTKSGIPLLVDLPLIGRLFG